jgi:hypothetical protein
MSKTHTKSPEKVKLSEELEQQIADYLKRGGEVDELPSVQQPEMRPKIIDPLMATLHK